MINDDNQENEQEEVDIEKTKINGNGFTNIKRMDKIMIVHLFLFHRIIDIFCRQYEH